MTGWMKGFSRHSRRRNLRLECLEERALFAVGDLRFVTYNVHALDNSFGRGSGLPSSDLGTVLQAIGTEVTNGLSRPVDLVALQEVRSQATTTADVVSQLNAIYGSGIYARGTLNGSSVSGLETVGLVYNTQTLDLLGEAAIGVPSTSGPARQTLRYQMRPDGGAAETEFYIYVSHFKAGDQPADMDRREVEAEAIRADADALGQGVNIIYVGDFNLQESSEGAYQDLLAVGNGQAFDPINSPGTWHNNNFFRAILTQAPMNTPTNPAFTGGGLDDRFDFQLISGELTNGTGLEYLANSYHTFGNNGSLGINSNINDAGNTALPGLVNRTTILNLLATVSDHLPVVADFNAPAAASVQFVLANQTVSEGTTSFTVSAQLSTAVGQNVSIPYTLSGTATGSGTDYTLTSANPLTITAGNLSGSITFNVNNDTLDELNETIIVTLGTPTNASLGATTVHTTTITDNDPAPTVQFTTSTQTVSESASAITMTAQLSAISGQTVTVPFTVAGTASGSSVDYTQVTSSPLTIPAGSLSGSITFNIINDVLDEAHETIAVTLSAPTNATLGATTSHTAAIQDDDLLQVTSLTPTATGFTVNFSSPLNAALVNLYDQNNTYGAADVVLTGAAVGNVRGSAVLNAVGDQLTFVRTGGYDLSTNSFGVLPPDHYTVTLRSGANGLVGLFGDQLDGDGNGTSGDDHTATFVVAAPATNAVTLGLPDFARGYGQVVNVPASGATGIPLTISRGADLTNVAFTLQYDPALLTISGATKGPGVAADAVLNVDTSTAGLLVISLSSSTQLSFFNAPFTLVNLTASVPETAPYTEKQRLTIAGATVNSVGGPLPVVTDNAVHVAAYFGDVDASRSYNSADLPALQRVLTGSNSGFGSYRNADPLLLADLSADGALRSDDASLVYRLIQSIAVSTVPAIPSGIVLPPPTGADPRISISRELTARAGEVVAVPIWLEATDPNPITLAAADIALAYDPTELSFVRVRGGSLLGIASQSMGPARLGEIELHAWSSQGAVSLNHGDLGSLVIVEFRVAENVAGPLSLNLTPGRQVRTAAYDADLTSLVLDPVPTWSNNDEIDGLISLLAQESLRPMGPFPLPD